MAYIIKSPCRMYLRFRHWLFSKDTWNNFYHFVSLPELKCCKTITFIISVIL